MNDWPLDAIRIASIQLRGWKDLEEVAEAGAGDEDAPSGEVKVYPKSEQVRDQILAATMGNTLFAGITMEQRESVVDAMFEVKCKPAQVVIAEGDMGE